VKQKKGITGCGKKRAQNEQRGSLVGAQEGLDYSEKAYEALESQLPAPRAAGA